VGNLNQGIINRFTTLQGNANNPPGKSLLIASYHLKSQFTFPDACWTSQGNMMNAWTQALIFQRCFLWIAITIRRAEVVHTIQHLIQQNMESL